MTRDPDQPAIGQFGQALRGLIKASGKTYQQLADEVPCAKSTISDAVSCDPDRVPGTQIIEGICRACGADSSTLARVLDLRAQAKRPPPPAPLPWHRRLVAGVAGLVRGPILWWKVVVALSLLAVMVVGGVTVVKPWIWCGAGFEVRRIGDQCIGITTGQVVLRDDLADVLGKIGDENAWVDRSGQDAVSVAYLVSLPPRSSADELEVVLKHEFEGAYIAQWEANHTKILGDRPLIRVLVANDGADSSEWQRVVPDVLGKVTGSDHLVAAVVTGRSLLGTVDAIDHLREGGVPVIASRLTGDSLTTLDRNRLAGLRGGLARVAPTNSDQAIAAAAYLKKQASRAVLVQDVKPADPYIQSLGTAFRQGFQDLTHHVLDPVETYNSGIGGAANTMGAMLRNICQEKPDVVFFAGRTPELGAFVQALPGRPCPEMPIRIVAGADSVEFASEVVNNAELRNGLNANSSMVYTTQASPGAWAISAGSFNAEPKRRFGNCQGCFNNVFPAEPLDDGAAIIGYDAITIAVTAVRPGQDQGTNPRPELVSQQFNRMHGTEAIAGASGWISLNDGTDGNTVNKAVAIQQVTANGRVEFLSLSSVDGSPCVPNVTRC